MRTGSVRRRLAAAAIGVAAVSLLAGCGQIHPGAAAQVGEQRVTMSEVDDIAADVCTAFEPQFQQQQQIIPMRYVKQAVVQAATMRELVRQVAEERAVDAPESYREDLAKVEAQAADVPASARDSFIEFLSTEPYVNAMLLQAGGEALQDEGQAQPTNEEAAARGASLLSDYAREVGVDIDPRYGLELQDGEIVPTDRSVSLAVSDLATRAEAAEPDQEYAANLGESQRCG
ncbi:hypothetical protein [Nocardioides speluncae]|uniref:hypothetical protein n=1 Tax=Nocardioides speluncae TaxID=2670337 RepID=UPI001F0B8495|nr:hypothetical protein [Nocardioides speluncae]